VFNGKTTLVTGGTGSFGKKFIKHILKEYDPKKVIIFSRDELKQYEMASSEEFQDKRLRFFIGDVRDENRMRRAMEQVQIVVHAAALKQVPACEYNPIEAVLTNVMGARNIIEAALDSEVERVLALSTDKAANPVNLYGATKLVAEKLFVQSNAYSGRYKKTKFSCVRYGNVVGSRGSVIPFFLKQKETGKLPITDPRMTRFWITLDQGVRFVEQCVNIMNGGEVFIPKIPSMNIMDLAGAIAPECKIEEVGIRPGEKLHEILVSEDEARSTIEMENMYIIQPSHPWWTASDFHKESNLKDGFSYSSDNNTEQLTEQALKDLCGDVINQS
jgi:UDP-N-acetylglucosamine 4,6-dehydratase